LTQATPEVLLQKALERASGGRNNAGFWLAQQVHANGYAGGEAEEIMRRFAASVGGGDRSGYTEAEAIATLRAEYRRVPKAPWKAGSSAGYSSSWKERKAEQVKRFFPTTPPPAQDNALPAEALTAFFEQCKGLEPLTGSPAADYLLSRGIPESLAEAARVKYHPTWGRGVTKTKNGGLRAVSGMGPCVVFPFYGSDDKPVAASGRAISGKEHRTYGPKSAGVFATPGALDADPVAVCEAPIDALSLAAAGLPALAVAGCSNLPPWLVKRLAKPAESTPAGCSRTVYLAHDNDPAGEKAAERIGANLPLIRGVRLCPNGKDWNADLLDMGADTLAEWLRNAAGKPGENKKALTTIPATESPSSPVCGHSVEIPTSGTITTPCKHCGVNVWRYEPCAFDGAGGYVCIACKRAARL
jgi:hypothetical protein